jgi:two-component system nitrate/nitrite response regulator NarL
MMRDTRHAKKTIRILIADAEGIFRLGLKKLFGVEDDLRVVAQADQPTQVLGLAKKFKPDVFFLQSEMLGPDPADFLARLRQVWAGGKIVVITSAVAGPESDRYIRGGAAGVVLRSSDPELYVKSARRVMKNELWLPKPLAPSPVPPAKGAAKVPLRPVDTLTRRERSVISCLVQGWRNREIAERLHITEQTVKNHLRTIYDKVGVSDRLELALYAIHQKLDLPPAPQVESVA